MSLRLVCNVNLQLESKFYEKQILGDEDICLYMCVYERDNKCR